MPAKGPATRPPRPPAPPTRPAALAEWVTARVTSENAREDIDEPSAEASWPVHRAMKSRLRFRGAGAGSLKDGVGVSGTAGSSGQGRWGQARLRPRGGSRQ